MKNQAFSAIILAAGGSTRMGRAKHLLKYDENQTFLDNLVSKFCEYGCREVIVVFNPMEATEYLKAKAPAGFRIAVNNNPGLGRFSSLKKGVQELAVPTASFVTNCDNPFISLETLKILSEKVAVADYIYPLYGGRGGHPFLISARVVGSIKNERDQTTHMRDYLNGFVNIGVEVEDKCVLTNINSEEDYRNFFQGNGW